MTRLNELIALVQETIDKGATTVEEVHRAIMNQPLEVIEKVAPSLEGTAESVRNVQNRTIGGVYDIIRTVNKEVGKIAQELLVNAERSAGDGGGLRDSRRADRRGATGR